MKSKFRRMIAEILEEECYGEEDKPVKVEYVIERLYSDMNGTLNLAFPNIVRKRINEYLKYHQYQKYISFSLDSDYLLDSIEVIVRKGVYENLLINSYVKEQSWYVKLFKVIGVYLDLIMKYIPKDDIRKDINEKKKPIAMAYVDMKDEFERLF